MAELSYLLSTRRLRQQLQEHPIMEGAIFPKTSTLSHSLSIRLLRQNLHALFP